MQSSNIILPKEAKIESTKEAAKTVNKTKVTDNKDKSYYLYF
jgi:hypothetical protein